MNFPFKHTQKLKIGPGITLLVINEKKINIDK